MIVLGVERDALRFETGGAVGAVGAAAESRHLALRRPVRETLLALSRARRLIEGDGYESVHVLDARFAPVALRLRRRYGIAASASVSALDLRARTPMSILGRRALPRLDQAFAADREVIATLRLHAPQLPVATLSHVALPLPRPSESGLASFARILERVAPGRLVVAMPWPGDLERARWYRDAVWPLLLGDPVTLFLGVPSRRDFRLLTMTLRRRADFIAHHGRVDAALIATAARCVDAFVLTGGERRDAEVESLAFAASGVPVVASARGGLIEHEENGLVVPDRDGFALVSTLNRLLTLPAQQRHCLGVEFAAHALRRWPASANAPLYAARFAALVGRPQIPDALRAA